MELIAYEFVSSNRNFKDLYSFLWLAYHLGRELRKGFIPFWLPQFTFSAVQFETELLNRAASKEIQYLFEGLSITDKSAII